MLKQATESKSQQQKLLKAQCDQVRKELASIDGDELSHRYRISCIVLGVKNSARYGSNRVEFMEEQLGLSKQSLYKYALVAERWSPEKFKALAKRKNRKGLPIPWSHLVEIAAIKDGRTRTGLVDRFFSECLTVEKLRELISESQAPAQERTSKVVSSVVAAQHLNRTLDAIEREVQTWDKRVLPTLVAHRETLKKADIERLRKASDRLDSAKAMLAKLSGQIEKLLPPSTPDAKRIVETESGSAKAAPTPPEPAAPAPST